MIAAEARRNYATERRRTRTEFGDRRGGGSTLRQLDKPQNFSVSSVSPRLIFSSPRPRGYLLCGFAAACAATRSAAFFAASGSPR